jgi:hypothetical protein
LATDSVEKVNATAQEQVAEPEHYELEATTVSTANFNEPLLAAL